MKTCKDCLHYKACFATLETCGGTYEFNARFSEIEGILCQKCEHFADRSEWVHLPCKVKDLYSLEAIRKKGVKNKYAIVQYDCHKNKPFKIVSYDIIGKDLLKDKDLLLYDYLPSMNFTVIANDFNTREEAEKALERVKEND